MYASRFADAPGRRSAWWNRQGQKINQRKTGPGPLSGRTPSDHPRYSYDGGTAINIQVPTLPGSLTPETQYSAADRDAATVLDPDTYVVGAPFDALARLRTNAPVHPVSLPNLPRAWLLTRHSDVRRVSRDSDTFSSTHGNTLVEVEMAPTSAMLPGIDPPRHAHYRKLINQGFTMRNVQRLEPHMRKVARDIVADITEKGEFDAVPDISAEMSLQVIADVLGVPASDRLDVFR